MHKQEDRRYVNYSSQLIICLKMDKHVDNQLCLACSYKKILQVGNWQVKLIANMYVCIHMVGSRGSHGLCHVRSNRMTHEQINLVIS